MLFWTPHFSILGSSFFVLDSTFWLDSTLKIDPATTAFINDRPVRLSSSPILLAHPDVFWAPPLCIAVEPQNLFGRVNRMRDDGSHTGRLLCSRPLGGVLSDCASDVCLSVAYIGPKSRTERPRKTKIGTEVAHVTRDTTFKVKRSNVNLQGAGVYCGGIPHVLVIGCCDRSAGDCFLQLALSISFP